jgi:hypothetical protein
MPRPAPVMMATLSLSRMLSPLRDYCLNIGSCGAQFSPFWRIAQRTQINESTDCFKRDFN